MAVFLFCVSPSYGQSTVSGEISASIVTPFTIAKQSDLEFNHIVADFGKSSHTNGTGTLQRRSLSTHQESVNGCFAITGAANECYGITFPTSFSLPGKGYILSIIPRIYSSSGGGFFSNRGTDEISISARAVVITADNINNVGATDEFYMTIFYN